MAHKVKISLPWRKKNKVTVFEAAALLLIWKLILVFSELI